MTDTITRWECPECGAHMESRHEPHGRAGSLGTTWCRTVPVERTYVLEGTERQEFIDALLHESLRGAVSVPASAWDRSIRAAINAVTKEKP